jgi:hypothetical protein
MRVPLRLLLVGLLVTTLQVPAVAQPAPTGEKAKTKPEVAPSPVAPSPASHRTFWKVSLATNVAVAVGGGVFAAVSKSRMNSQLDNVALQIMGNGFGVVGSNDCGKPYQQILDNSGVTSFNYAALQRACTWHTRSYTGYAVAGVGVSAPWSR